MMKRSISVYFDVATLLLVALGLFAVLAFTGCADDDAGVSTEPAADAQALRSYFYYPELEDNGGLCFVESYARNDHSAACSFIVYYRIRLTGDAEGEFGGYGFGYIPDVPPGGVGESYGDVGDERSGVRYYVRDCSEVVDWKLAYVHQGCADGFEAEQGDRAAYERTARLPTEYEQPGYDHDAHGGAGY